MPTPANRRSAEEAASATRARPVCPLTEAALRCLAASPYPTLRDIQCDCRDGRITLRGRVASYYLKQMAQEVVRELYEADRITNQIEVIRGMAAGRAG